MDTSSQNRAAERMAVGSEEKAAAVGVAALAGSDPMQDALNPSREADRIASVLLDGVVYQAVGYVSDSDRSVVVAVRNDQGAEDWTAWEAHVFDGTDGLADLGSVDTDIHNWVSVGFDPTGHLHLTWDMHNDPLKYRRSAAPVDDWDGALTNNLAMRGANEDSVTYVRFHLLEGTLYATFRDGGSGRGDWYFYAYDPEREVWEAGPGLEATDGMLIEGQPDDQNPYLFRDPAMDEQGNIHLAWNWRGAPDVSTNHKIEYCMWNGSQYVTTSGEVLSVPLREGEAELVEPAGNDSGLEDMAALAVDAEGHPHLAYRKDGPEGHMQMFHRWYDGSEWRSTQLTETEYPSYYALTNDGGMYLSGAAIAPFSDGTVAILFTDQADANHLAMWTAEAPFADWSKNLIYEEMDLGYYEAGIDRRMLREQDQLHVPIAPWDESDPSDGWPLMVLEAPAPPPIAELTGFEAAVEEQRVRLTWETASETGLAEFEVQRSTPSEPFTTIASIEAAGAPDAPHTYDYTDEDLPSGVDTLTYRLRLIGEDGRTTFSPEVEVRVTLPEELRVTLSGHYPNPVHEQSTIPYEITLGAQVRLTLHNTVGQHVQTLVYGFREAGRHQVVLNAQPLASGMYLLRLRAEGESAEDQLTVVK